MKFSKYLQFTTIESNNVFFTWSANLDPSKQIEIQQVLSRIGKSNIGEYYNVPRSSFSELYEYEVVAQKLAEDGSLMIMLE